MTESLELQIGRFIASKNRNVHVGDEHFRAYFRHEQYPLAAFESDDLSPVKALAFDSLTATPERQGHFQRFLKILANQDLSGYGFVICKNIANVHLRKHLDRKGWKEMKYHPRSLFLSVSEFVEMYASL